MENDTKNRVKEAMKGLLQTHSRAVLKEEVYNIMQWKEGHRAQFLKSYQKLLADEGRIRALEERLKPEGLKPYPFYCNLKSIRICMPIGVEKDNTKKKQRNTWETIRTC